MAIISIDNGDWSESFLWLILCFVIDSVDGTLARWARVEEVLPDMDGKMIDYVIDFTTYALIPAFFFYKAQMVDDTYMLPALAIMLLSSTLYYGKKDMVADEEYFVGFPVLWNFVVFFQFFVFDNHPLLNFISVVVFGVLHFVPLRFAYPSKSRRFFWTHFIISLIGVGGAIMLLLKYPEQMEWTKVSVMIGGSYFTLFAIYDTYTYTK